ncbi:R2-like ligand-binding oxidase [Laceyella putida]|uniref:R2-like ligand binding oxidase n=1 Tax=Laceyella putida TaxID=110101 RepID=A0ABW2RI43_9BACL
MEGFKVRVMKTTSEKRLNHSILPMRLYHKAKKFGIWDPRDIDFTQDQEDWKTLKDDEKEAILRLCSMFQAGEEAVTLDLLPLIRVISLEGRLEEEMYLTTFLWEEAKHTEIFRRFLDEVTGEVRDLSIYHLENYRKIFYEFLPQAMERLVDDGSPEAQAEASVTYNMVVEGILAETGYHAFYNSLQRQGKMPGMIQAVGYLKKDESRHLGYGSYLLQRLISEHDHVWDVINKRMEMLLPFAIGVVNELFNEIDPYPFGLDKEEFIHFAMKQFQVRMDVLERARGKTLDEIYSVSEHDVGVI